MADSDDIERLLAEVDSTLGGAKTPKTPAKRARSDAASGGSRVSGPVLAGVISGGLVFLLFAVLPFLGAISGAAGAFLGAAGTALLLSLRRR